MRPTMLLKQANRKILFTPESLYPHRTQKALQGVTGNR